MAKRDANTLLEQHGFADSDFYNPKHDAICSWVDDNAAALLKEDLQCIAETFMVEWGRPLPHGAGFVDIMLTAGGKTPDTNMHFFIEVKTQIESLGAILRELQFYRVKTSAPKERVVLVCPQTNGLERVRKQGFKVIVYDPLRFRVAKQRCGVFPIQ